MDRLRSPIGSAAQTGPVDIDREMRQAAAWLGGAGCSRNSQSVTFEDHESELRDHME